MKPRPVRGGQRLTIRTVDPVASAVELRPPASGGRKDQTVRDCRWDDWAERRSVSGPPSADRPTNEASAFMRGHCTTDSSPAFQSCDSERSKGVEVSPRHTNEVTCAARLCQVLSRQNWSGIEDFFSTPAQKNKPLWKQGLTWTADRPSCASRGGYQRAAPRNSRV